MKNFVIISLFTTLLITSGCGAMPQTPDEFRAAVPGSFSGISESYEVNKSIGFVKSKFKKYGKKCLDKRVTITSTSNTGYNNMPVRSTTVIDYKPTVKLKKNSAELYIQQTNQSAVSPRKMPEGGFYIGVVDATKLKKKKTKIDIYRGKWGNKTMWKAIKGWVDGSVKGCPDLTK